MPVVSLAGAARHSKCTEKESIWDSREESVGGRARKSKRKALGVHPDRKLNDIHRFYKYNTVLDSSERSSRPRNTRAVSLSARTRLHASTELLGAAGRAERWVAEIRWIHALLTRWSSKVRRRGRVDRVGKEQADLSLRRRGRFGCNERRSYPFPGIDSYIDYQTCPSSEKLRSSRMILYHLTRLASSLCR